MYFQDIPQECMEQLNDPGESFTMERRNLVMAKTGSMQIFVSPAVEKDPSITKETRKIEFETSSDKNVSTANTVTSQNNQLPETLFFSCVKFVAVRLHFVESFINFPEDIGKTIFEVSEKNRMFFSYSNTVHHNAIKLFCDAYADHMLTKLDLSGMHWAVNSILPKLAVFNGLRKLDISCCKLGDYKNSMLQISHFQCLNELSLHHNKLDDWHIRQLTLSLRMFGNGAKVLKKLDLSCNPLLTDTTAKFICCYTELEQVILSGSAVRMNGILILKERLHLNLIKATEVDKTVCCTDGWAKNVVLSWLKLAQPKARKECNAENEQRSKKTFYGVHSSNYETSEAEPIPHAIPVIILGRKNDHCDSERKQISAIAQNSSHETEKRLFMDKCAKKKFTLESAITAVTEQDINSIWSSPTNIKKQNELPTEERLKSQEIDGMDMDLLLSYKNSSLETSKTTNLLSAMFSDKW